jgi:hypothetical protein
MLRLAPLLEQKKIFFLVLVCYVLTYQLMLQCNILHNAAHFVVYKKAYF